MKKRIELKIEVTLKQEAKISREKDL